MLSKTGKPRFINTNRLAAVISLAIHFIGFVFALFFVIEKRYNIIESYVEVEIAETKRPPKLRRRFILHRSKTQQINPTEVQTPRLKTAVDTIADIPTGRSNFVLPRNIFRHSFNLDDAIIANIGPPIQINPTARVIPPVRTSPKVTFNSSPKFQVVNPMESVADAAELTIKEIPTDSSNEPPKFIHEVVPEYPEIAQRAGKDGIVILEAKIGIDGIARDIKIIQKLGYGCDEAAINALKASKFSPARKGKIPVAVRIQIPYRFQFED